MPDISYLMKLGAIVIVFVTVLGAIILGGVMTLQGQPLPPYVTAIAGAGLAQCLTLLGVHAVGASKNGKNGNGNGGSPSASTGAH